MPKFLNDKDAFVSADLYSEVFERKGVKFLKGFRPKVFRLKVSIIFLARFIIT